MKELTRLSTLAALLGATLLTSCGETTKREIGEDPAMRSRLDAFIAEGAKLSEAYDFDFTPIEFEGTLDPDIELGANGNAIILSQRHLWDLSTRVELTNDDYLNLNTAGYVHRLLQSTYASEPLEEGWLDEIESLLATRYFIIVGALDYVPPKILESHYEGGSAKLIVSLYDRESQSYRCRFVVAAQARGEVEATAEEWRLKENLVFEINSKLRQELMDKIRDGLTERTGADFGRKLEVEAEAEIDPADADDDEV